jgi:hypothetical protein
MLQHSAGACNKLPCLIPAAEVCAGCWQSHSSTVSSVTQLHINLRSVAVVVFDPCLVHYSPGLPPPAPRKAPQPHRAAAVSLCVHVMWVLLCVPGPGSSRPTAAHGPQVLLGIGAWHKARPCAGLLPGRHTQPPARCSSTPAGASAGC